MLYHGPLSWLRWSAAVDSVIAHEIVLLVYTIQLDVVTAYLKSKVIDLHKEVV